MVEHVCIKCEKVFKQKSQLDAHKNRKTPCKKDGTIEKIVEKKVEEVLARLNVGIAPSACSSPPTFIEVCAGCGGLSTGFINAGFQPILLNEINKKFCDTLARNHPGTRIENKDMLALNLSEFNGRVDVLMGGVPCQAFSQAGERMGLEDPRGKLIVEFNRLVLECNPKVILVENVKGLTTHNRGETLKGIIELFKNNGKYTVHTKILNAKDYEVPQKRERIIIVGVRSDIARAFEYPTPSKTNVLLRDVLTNVPPSIGAKYPDSKKAVFDLVPPGGCWVNLPDDVKLSYMGEKCLASGGGKRGIARRMSMDEHCLTLTTSPCQKQTDRCHPLETRPFTVREYARIQTFPDTYIFSGGMADQYKQIGNAVPVNLALAVAHQVKSILSSS
jgi:DNA (cytosine-5)-methyltransferase 1